MAVFLTALVFSAPGLALGSQDKNGTEKAADARDKIVCKRTLETGSLVRGRRECKTKWEWERDRELIRSQLGETTCKASNGVC